MSFISGALRLLYIQQDGVYLPVGCLTSNGFEESSEMVGTTTRDNIDGWTSSIPSNQSYSISFDGILTDEFDSTVIITYYELQLLKRNRTLINWRIESVEGEFEDGQGYISNIANQNNIDEFVSFNGTITGVGIPDSTEEGFLLLEDGNFLLLQTGGKIKL